MQELTTKPGASVRPRNPLKAWFDVRKRSVSSWAFALNRLTGLGLTLYLFLHLIVLSTLLRGEAGWDAFIRLARSPYFLAMDVVLIFGMLFHGLNGIRVTLVGMGISARTQRTLLWVLILICAIVLAAAAIRVYTI
jgi:succinate dehydrogenase / fumarate reductase cytochrome b subunit